MKFYSCSGSAPDLASRGECSFTSAVSEMEKLAKHYLKETECAPLAGLLVFMNSPPPPKLASFLNCHRVGLSFTEW